jgi:hypothetical protein
MFLNVCLGLITAYIVGMVHTMIVTHHNPFLGFLLVGGICFGLYKNSNL